MRAIVDGEGRSLVSHFVSKIEGVVWGPEDRLETGGLRLEEHPYSEADIIHEGTTTHCKVDGIIRITGGVTVCHPDGTMNEVTYLPQKGPGIIFPLFEQLFVMPGTAAGQRSEGVRPCWPQMGGS